MNTTHKTIYVVGGTNGVGKSTIREELLDSSIPYINADLIVKELKAQHASLMLAELARQYDLTSIDEVRKLYADIKPKKGDSH